ncbi:MAG: hypothetical protein ABI877_18670 [Gemmatimonadaceae bacterium]
MNVSTHSAEPNLAATGRELLRERDEKSESRIRDDEPHRSARQRENQILGEQQLAKVAGSGAHRAPNDQLSLAPNAANEREVRDVGARDQKYERRSAHQLV